MIYVSRIVTVNKGTSLIDDPIVLFKGDKNIEVQFTIKNNPFKSKDGASASSGQLIINREASPLFSEINPIANNKITFIITGEMIDELEEVGDYDFQIRLYDKEQTSRVTLPPVHAGIVIKAPICEEAAASSTYVNNRRAAIPASNDMEEAFDETGNYNKTTWTNGDIITDVKLNKVENAIYTINDNMNTDYSTVRYVDESIVDVENYIDNTVELESKQLKEYVQNNYSTKYDVNNAINNCNDMNREYINDAIASIELIPGPQGEQGPMGPQGEPGKDADPADLEGYATEDYAHNYVDSAIVILDEILYEGETYSLLNQILGEGK